MPAKKLPIDVSKRSSTKKDETTKAPKTAYVDIDTFIQASQLHFGYTDGQAEGFKAFMVGKHYQKNERDFIPYLEEYLGKKLR